MPSATIDRKQRSVIPLNRRPLQQAAKMWLVKLKAERDPETPYLLSLMMAAFERGILAPGILDRDQDRLEMSFGSLLGPKYSPSQVMSHLLSQPSLGPPREQAETLEQQLRQAKTPERAMEVALEWFGEVKKATNPTYGQTDLL